MTRNLCAMIDSGHWSHVTGHLLDENRLLEHQLVAQTPGPAFRVARANEARCGLFAGNQMSGRPVSGACSSIRRLRFGLSRGKILQWCRDSLENKANRSSRVALR